MRWESIDALFVCTPPALHAHSIAAAIENDKPVLAEKPIAMNASEARTLLSLLDARPTVNAVGYMNRYRRSVRQARNLVESSTTFGIACHWACREYGVPWWLDADLSGGPFNEQATHIVDLCRYLLGEITSVQAMSEPTQRPGTEKSVAALLKYQNGSLGTLFYTCLAPEKSMRVDIFASKGFLQLSGWSFDLTINTIDGSISASEPDIFLIETESFLEAVAKNDQSKILCSFSEACKTQLTVDAIRSSLLGVSAQAVEVA